MADFRTSQMDKIKKFFRELEDICSRESIDDLTFRERLKAGFELMLKTIKCADFKFDGSFAPIHGRCPYQCEYCYAHLPYQDISEADKHYNLRSVDYRGPLCLNEEAFNADLQEGKFIIVSMGNDLWASSTKFIDRTLDFLSGFPNRYNFLTKNPARFEKFLNKIPQGSMLSCTIETDAYQTPGIYKAPSPAVRAEAFKRLDWPCKQLVLMPVLPFNSQAFFDMICQVNPDYLSFNAFDARPWAPHPSDRQILKLIDLIKMIVKYTGIKFVGDIFDTSLYDGRNLPGALGRLKEIDKSCRSSA